MQFQKVQRVNLVIHAFYIVLKLKSYNLAYFHYFVPNFPAHSLPHAFSLFLYFLGRDYCFLMRDRDAHSNAAEVGWELKIGEHLSRNHKHNRECLLIC